MRTNSSGEIITFYSYKGGTGRSMALANVGCLLAEQLANTGQSVLMVDWDLEAPGLHHYFYNRLSQDPSQISNVEQELEDHPGLIDFFLKINKATPLSGYKSEDEAAEQAVQVLKEIPPEQFIIKTAIPNLFLLKAGRFDENYSQHVSTFGWENLHTRSPWLFRSLAESWGNTHRYVLIDSRTGLTDTSGICTIIMPEKLVVVFTPNRQSLTGITNLVRSATTYRKRSDDVRRLLVFPLASRIESQREELRDYWRFGNPERKIIGYQPLFEGLLKEVYDLSECDLDEYFREVQIQQTADYAYGEEIAVTLEKSHDRFSLARSYQTLTRRLVASVGPWKQSEATPSQGQISPIPSDLSVVQNQSLVVNLGEALVRPEELAEVPSLCIASYNVHLFGSPQDVHSGQPNPPATSEQLNALAKMIIDLNADAIAFQGVQNESMLSDLIRKKVNPKLEKGARFTTFICIPSHDPRGINVALATRLAVNGTMNFNAREFGPQEDIVTKRFSRDLMGVDMNATPSYRFLFFVAHIKSRLGGEDSEYKRSLEPGEIRSVIETPTFGSNPFIKQDMVLAGDMNDDPDARTIEILRGDGPGALQDVLAEVEPNYTYPTHTRYPKTRLDYIFASPSIRVTDAKIHRENPAAAEASDHYPVSVTIKLPRRRKT